MLHYILSASVAGSLLVIFALDDIYQKEVG